jgi:hypothetical protein
MMGLQASWTGGRIGRPPRRYAHCTLDPENAISLGELQAIAALRKSKIINTLKTAKL